MCILATGNVCPTLLFYYISYYLNHTLDLTCHTEGLRLVMVNNSLNPYWGSCWGILYINCICILIRAWFPEFFQCGNTLVALEGIICEWINLKLCIRLLAHWVVLHHNVPCFVILLCLIPNYFFTLYTRLAVKICRKNKCWDYPDQVLKHLSLNIRKVNFHMKVMWTVNK
jgi:hypothetical protein